GLARRFSGEQRIVFCDVETAGRRKQIINFAFSIIAKDSLA
ncbi:MAG: hypothetical protein RJA42_737, partial [Bacteroidota bacterium]